MEVEGEMSTIEDVMRRLQALDKIQEDIKGLQNDFTKVLALETKVKEYTDEIGRLSKKFKQLGNFENKLKRYEGIERSKNLIIYNWNPPRDTQMREAVLAFLTGKLKISATLREIEQVRYMGKDQNAPPPIWISFSTQSLKWECLKAARNLQGSNIYLREDLPLETRHAQKELNEYRKKAREDGVRAFIRRDKLMVEGTP
ncbi:MAG: hypothetical protein L0922_08340 [Candidatus Mariimomonas ferrooxydans]